MKDYAKLPWIVGTTEDGKSCVWFDGKEEPQDEMGDIDTWIDCSTNENARRVAACVNACAGLDTELLENIVLTGDTLKARFEALKKQRLTMNNFTQDWKHRDTAPKMNKYEMAYYCITFSIVLIGLTVVLPLMIVGLI